MCKEETQAERFKQTARELGVELDEDKLKEALRRMKEPPPSKPDSKSDDE